MSYRGLVSSILVKYEGASMSSKLLAIDDRNKSVGLAMARPADFTCHEVGPIDPTCVLEDATISGQALEVLACASADSVATSARTAWWVCNDAIQNDKPVIRPLLNAGANTASITAINHAVGRTQDTTGHEKMASKRVQLSIGKLEVAI